MCSADGWCVERGQEAHPGALVQNPEAFSEYRSKFDLSLPASSLLGPFHRRFSRGQKKQISKGQMILQ
jgi:hypothetical protein